MKTVLILVCVLFAAHAAIACSVCFGDPDDPQSHGMNMAILTLLGITAGVLGTIAAFGIRIALRIRRAELAAAAANPEDFA